MRALILIAALLAAGTAQGYTLVTSVSASCHERLTFEAIVGFLETLDRTTLDFEVPNDRITRRLMKLVSRNLPEGLTDAELFVALSIVVGVRAPDTEGHSTLNLTALRRLHADPAPAGQYAHALRGPDDDGLEGDLIAIEGTKRVIREQLEIAASHLDGLEVSIDKRAFFVDHYETIDVPVGLAAYHLGRAIHALQDAHAHMVRSGDDFEWIVHVTNYVDAVNGVLEADRDGLAHSNALDDCNRDDVAPISAKGRERTTALVAAFDAVVRGRDPGLIELGLSPCADAATDPIRCGWIEYDPVCKAAIEAGDTAQQAEVCCTAANDFCEDTVPAARVAHKDPAGPYLGCTARPGGSGPAWLGGVLVLLAFARRRVFGVVGALWLLVGSAGAEPTAGPSAEAPTAYVEPPAWYLGVEAHGAGLNDTPNASILDLEFGYSVRFGRRFGRWRFGGVVDRSLWIPLEYQVRVDAGVLNLGGTAEVLLFDDFIRIGVGGGACILLFDAVFDDAGSTGYFGEVRPAGFRWTPIEALAITFDPISVSVLQPVLRDPPLRKIHRRVSVGVEYLL